MRTFLFEKEKYGFELLMDLHKFEENEAVYFESEIHITNFFEVFIFEEATGDIELGGHNIKVTNKTLFFISPYQKKKCVIDTKNIKGFHLVFQNDFLSDFFEDKLLAYRMQYFYNAQYPQSLQVSSIEYELIKFILSEITSEIQNFQNDSTHIIRSLLYFFLSKINRLYSKQYNLSSETQGNSIVYKFKEALELHIRSVHTVDEYCTLLHITRHQLNSIVKKYTGNTSKDAIHFRLLQEIKMELLYSDKTISEIAMDLNFSEANNLTRFFSRLEGITPTKFRNQLPN
ncbi:AraC family transcriptional regulator [uncultured Kordia sp.]|uniref:helix-turn-helix domain-containing protein n=1 Tax=uncultured Kordia sp. TaxID=507699 RepID=UPI002622BC09|nr:AraC family transcriptional regulator [uncultured Kordia sp.]